MFGIETLPTTAQAVATVGFVLGEALLLSSVSMALIFGAAIIVSGAILYRAAVNIRQASRVENLAE